MNSLKDSVIHKKSVTHKDSVTHKEKALIKFQSFINLLASNSPHYSYVTK